MDIAIRPATDNDINACGRICYEGFRVVAERHGFAPVYPSVEIATQRVGGLIRHPSVFGVVAEARDGRIVGFSFLSERESGESGRSSLIRPCRGRGSAGS